MSGFSPAFERLGAAYAAVAAQQQEVLAEFLPAADWNTDLATGTYTQGDVVLHVALIGSFAEDDRSWLWGWANPQFGAEHPAVLNPRAMGSRFGVPEMTTPELDLSWYEGPARNGGDLVAMVATSLLGLTGMIPGRYDGGVAYFAVRDPAVPTAAWDSVTAPRLITSGLSLFPADHRLTVMRFLGHHRLPYRQTETSITAKLPDGGSCVAEFDEQDRLANLSMTLPGR
ncbi:hypothetical protein NE236_12875 [Actinoallomurus purpureus]|uniref:DUF6882 domain-containing protein n=1 Tax=Actinoallomurus purpureus TaxID=478114 RepID=UPI00209312CC|nr:DUF6882 domain-containing protein [Actinoallomurus purpureus]MCO6005878.1 hypothetical protein [Actinoallomurus purpureus]